MSDEQPKRGGARPGSGRKPTGAKMRSFRLTDDQYKAVQAFVKGLKAKKPKE